MPADYLNLFFICVAAQFNELHSVQKRSGDCIKGIGGCDKHDVAQIKGKLQIVIPVSFILLTVQHLKKSRTGVTAIVRTHFIHFVQ